MRFQLYAFMASRLVAEGEPLPYDDAHLAEEVHSYPNGGIGCALSSEPDAPQMEDQGGGRSSSCADHSPEVTSERLPA
jgi:hypothetical protein